MVIPSKVMDRSHLLPFGIPSNSSSSFFSEELSVPEMQVGFWKSESMVNQKGSKSAFSSPLGKVDHHTVANPAGGLENPGGEAFKSHLDMFSLDNLMGQEKASSLPSISWGDDLTSSSSKLGLSMKEPAFVEPTSVDQRFPGYENSLSSSSFSEIFSSKSRSMASGVLGQSVDTNNSSWGEDEPLGSMEEIEAQTIGDLLPDNDDLISGIINDFEYTGLPTNLDNVDEDIFCTGGGMELENDAFFKTQLSGEQHTSEHPSRTLIIKNININIEDSELRVLLQQYGDIQMLYTSCKNHGFVMVSYYDIRAAQKAMRALHNKHLGPRNLDIHFSFSKDNISDKDINQGTLLVSVGSSVSNDDLCRMLSVYGEVKEICKAPTRCNQKLIEFYDVRAVEAAQLGLNKGDISGQKIKLERSSPGGARYCLTEHCSVETKQEECDGFLQQINNSVRGSIGKLAAKSQDNGSCHSVYSPVSPLMDESLHGISTGIPQKLSSPIRIESLRQHSNQAGHGELSGSLGQGSFGRGMHAFHPHSLPEFYNSMCNKSNSISPNGMNVNFKLAEGGDYSRTHKVGTGGLHGHSFDQNEAFGVSGIGSCPLHGQHYAWNNSNAFPQSPAAPMLWSNLRHPIHMHGYPGIPPQMLNTGVLPIEQHQLGLASAHGGSFADIHSFHPGSLGSIGFPGSPRLYPSDIAVFPPRGNYREAMFSPVSAGFPSPQQRCHAINGRNPMINVSSSYDTPNDRMRSRRHDGNAAQSDNKKQFELDIDCIANGEDSRTTLMIKNIPNKYTCKMLLAVIDDNHRGTYDFIYLPIDFKNKCNVGYSFINMTDPQHIISFFKTFNGKKWEKFNSEKVASLAYARIQGRSALIAHFQNSSLMNEDKWCRPMLFHKDGPNAGDQEPFPVGNNVRSRSGRNRPLTNSEAKQVSPSMSPNEENSSSRANSPSCSTEEPTD